MALEEYFKEVAGIVALGGAQAFATIVLLALHPAPDLVLGREIWLRFAVWIALSLEFALAADLMRTAIAVPTWAGQLPAIAAIRRALNCCWRDIEAFKVGSGGPEPVNVQPNSLFCGHLKW
jgi:uncharacterized membrane protein